MPTISAYVSNEIYNNAKDLADENNTSVSKIIKSAFANVEVKDKSISLQILNELQRIGNNLNQISKRCNIRKSVDIQTLKSLAEIEKHLQRYTDVS